MSSSLPRLLGAAGVLCGGLLAAALAVTWSKPEESEPVSTVVDYWRDHETAYQVLSFGVAPILAVLLVAFGVALRSALRSREAGEASFSALAFGGAVLAAAAVGLVGAIQVAAATAAADGLTDATVTLHRLDSFMFLPWVAGFSAMTLAAGIGGLRTTALPRWLAWVSIVMGVAFLTPVGFVPFLLMPLWLAVTGVTIVLRGREDVGRAVSRRSPATA
jgi:hypothetical protein